MKNHVTKRSTAAFFLFTMFILCSQIDVFAKSNDTIKIKKSNLQIELRTSYAFTICHHTEMEFFRAHYPVFELSLQQKTFGYKTWHQLLNYPSVGITFLGTNPGNFKELGNIFALYPYMSFNVLKAPKDMLNFRLGVGVGYATNHYDRETNPKNTFLGSNFNAAFSINVEYSRLLSERWQLSLYAGMFHMSNGSSRCPNNGINIAQAGLSARYFVSKPKERLPLQIIDNEQYKPWNRKTISYYFAFLLSPKDIDERMGYSQRWVVYNFQFHAMKRLTQMSKVGIGFDLVYDESDPVVLKYKDISCSKAEILKPGINVAYELVLKSTSFMFNFGAHLAGKERYDGIVYQKLNLKQNIGEHFFLTFGLTTHFGCADYVGFGAGFIIN